MVTSASQRPAPTRVPSARPPKGHYSLRTEEAYVGWIRRFILFHNKRHPAEMAEPEVNQFLSHLAVNGNVAASALSAVLFLYQDVLGRDLDRMEGVVRAKSRCDCAWC
jgi:integrase-like protein